MPKSSPKVRTPAMAPVQHGPANKSKKVLKKVARKPDVASNPNMRSKPGKMVYYFGQSRTEGTADMKALLGARARTWRT